ncbi:hypothetical protein PSTEL_23705 [Paenibacillus stellifer]|uniref:Copper amine oxidase-like N-terminal domain-containing protein n=1 Tax=Paenibacillus stellifer TaxID=169760 RepID=A0A089LVV3_9BACL|nr:stalk domain-containing protein [Paenibacillus stellifer]AIQ65666.1 hypothetical protein PSTEL_23705 [Paenibacillus stellifer]
MNKKMKKSVAALMVMGMTLSGAAGVYAGTNLQKISAYLDRQTTITVNGAAFTPTDSKGTKLAPINYQNMQYVPLRAFADALKVQVQFDAKTHTVTVGSKGEAPAGNTAGYSTVSYSKSQLQAIKAEFAKFQGFESAYAPMKMVQGDAFKQAAASDDGVSLLFTHMRVSVSPRDYSYEYDGTSVTLKNGLKGKWYTPSDTPMLTFKLDDRFVTLSSTDQSVSKTQLEEIAASVAKVK